MEMDNYYWRLPEDICLPNIDELMDDNTDENASVDSSDNQLSWLASDDQADSSDNQSQWVNTEHASLSSQLAATPSDFMSSPTSSQFSSSSWWSGSQGAASSLMLPKLEEPDSDSYVSDPLDESTRSVVSALPPEMFQQVMQIVESNISDIIKMEPPDEDETPEFVLPVVPEEGSVFYELKPLGPYTVMSEHSYHKVAEQEESDAATATIRLNHSAPRVNRGYHRSRVQSENVPPAGTRSGKPRRMYAQARANQRVTQQSKVSQRGAMSRVSAEAPRRGRRPAADISDSERKNHNEMERTRRSEQRLALVCLRREIPHLRTDEKAPKVKILSEGTKYIEHLKVESRKAELNANRLNEHNKKLHKKLKQLLKAYYVKNNNSV